MDTESNAMARPSPQQDADATLQPLADHAKTVNFAAVAEMSESADDARDSATMGPMSADAPADNVSA